ncbi:hypothetical protein [Azohydromonas aeria]|uniref:hypothetical protein n=1 Tax=Azohydromonas aeria TaxID=2590212 RepID=UPI0012F8961C|nr:hypothetical protein [Azohydromonas aeria]
MDLDTKPTRFITISQTKDLKVETVIATGGRSMRNSLKLTAVRLAIAIVVSIASLIPDMGFDTATRSITAAIIGIAAFVLMTLSAKNSYTQRDETEAFYFSQDQSPSHYPPHERH